VEIKKERWTGDANENGAYTNANTLVSLVEGTTMKGNLNYTHLKFFPAMQTPSVGEACEYPK